MKEKDRLLGETVVDFANAESPREAYSKHLKNIQRLMGFSSDFVERVERDREEELKEFSRRWHHALPKIDTNDFKEGQEIEDLQRGLRTDLEMIVSGESLREVFYELCYDKEEFLMDRMSLLRVEDNSITSAIPINETDYPAGYDTSVILNRDLNYCLITFLKSNDRKKIKKCPYCDKFFIAKDIKRQRCYRESCRKEFERLKKKKQREDEPEIYCY